MKDIQNVFADPEYLLNTIKEANKLTTKSWGDHVTLERAIFLSWWCDIATCKFCYMSTQKEKQIGPENAKRKPWRILAEAEICKRIGWNIEFLSGGYGSYTLEEIKLLTEMISHISQRPAWLNVGILNNHELDVFGDEVEGIVGAVEAIDDKLHKYVAPGKPLDKIKDMLHEAKDMDLKTGITIILGLGEKVDDLVKLFDFIEEMQLNRITFYALNAHRSTEFEDYPAPASLYQAGTIALTRNNFPDLEIIGGTWTDQLANIGPMLLAGTNGITKYPLFSMYGNKYGKKVEEEIKFANRKILGTFTDMDILKGTKDLPGELKPKNVYGYKRPDVSEEALKKIESFSPRIQEMVDEYIAKVGKK